MDTVAGTTLLLNLCLEAEGYESIFLVRNWGDGVQECMRRINLGRNRNITVGKVCRLVFVNDMGISVEEIDFADKSEIKIIDYLKDRGIVCKSIPYPLDKLKKQERTGIFTNNGYYLQDDAWLDMWTYASDMYLVRNQLMIEGRSVRKFSISHTSWNRTDILGLIRENIIDVLVEPVRVSEEEFISFIESKELDRAYRYTDVYYYPCGSLV